MLNYIAPLIAHRGASGTAPENTLAAFRQASVLGVRWVEFDVMLCRSGELVVIHDLTVNRTTNGHGNVADLTLTELQKLDAGSWFSQQFCGEKIPTLSETLTCLLALQMHANVEIKSAPGQEIATAMAVIAVLTEVWPTSRELPLLTSFLPAVMHTVLQYGPQYPRGLLLHAWTDDWLQQATTIQASSVHLRKNLLTQKRVAEIKATGQRVLGYTVNRASEARRLFAMEVDAVFTDYPARLADI